MPILCLLTVELVIQSQLSTSSGCGPQNAALCPMVTSFDVSVSMGLVETVSGTVRGHGWAEEAGGSSPALPWVGMQGQRCPPVCCCLGALLWSSCLTHPGSGFTPVWNMARKLLLSFKWLFLRDRDLRLGFSPESGVAAPVLLSQVSSLTLTAGLGLSSSEGPGGMDSPCLFSERWKDSFSKENFSVWSWPFYDCYSTGVRWIPWRDPTVKNKNTLFLSTSSKRSWRWWADANTYVGIICHEVNWIPPLCLRAWWGRSKLLLVSLWRALRARGPAAKN